MSGIGDDPPGTGEIDEDQEKEGNGAGNSTDTRKRSRSSPESEFKVIKKGKKEGCMSREELNKTMEMLNLHIYNLEYAVECNDKLTKTKKGEMNKDIVELKRITESLKAEMLSMIARSEVEVNVVKRLEVKMRTSVCNTIKQEVETSMKKILKEEMLGPVRNEDENMDISEDENQSQGIVGTVRNEIRTAVRELSQNRKSEDEGFQVVSYARVARGGGGSGKVKIPGVKPLPVPKQRKTFIIKPQEGNQDYKVPEDIKEGLKRNIRPGSLGMKVCRLVKTKDSVVVDMEQEETANMTGFIQQVKDLGLDCSEPGRKQPRIVIFDISSELQMEEMKRALCEQNRDIISTEAEEGIKPLYVYGKRTTGKVNCVLEVSPELRKKLIGKQRVYIGWESCRVLDHVRAIFCYKCQKFGHVAAKCEDNARCGWCGMGHETRDCEEVKKQQFTKKCVMCCDIGLNGTSHKAGSKECEAYKRRLEAFVKTINYG
ncbi:uncharacterized protein LOC113471673 [Diaphorina citri]|uniref:Uncharacterized protein LOC113471673 n=1 Tax=Diaphorina citri TaxID=121845 RepID=A0A3Q0JEH1_DIACI|nr:uncharacterized protein LOC113471673 [Diaphorina citri]